MGHPEPASGIAALVKMLISIQRGVIPGNLHYKEPNQDVPALLDGRIRVVNKNTQFRGGLMAFAVNGGSITFGSYGCSRPHMGRMRSTEIKNDRDDAQQALYPSSSQKPRHRHHFRTKNSSHGVHPTAKIRRHLRQRSRLVQRRIPLHYMTSIAPSLKSSLEKIIAQITLLTWISTSIPEQRCKDGTQI
jgi:hypothetical protein